MKQLSTLEVQDLIYKRRVRRMEIRKGRSIREIIGRANSKPPRAPQPMKEKQGKSVSGTDPLSPSKEAEPPKQ